MKLLSLIGLTTIYQTNAMRVQLEALNHRNSTAPTNSTMLA
jgi:hypothetical protein